MQKKKKTPFLSHCFFVNIPSFDPCLTTEFSRVRGTELAFSPLSCLLPRFCLLPICITPAAARRCHRILSLFLLSIPKVSTTKKTDGRKVFLSLRLLSFNPVFDTIRPPPPKTLRLPAPHHLLPESRSFNRPKLCPISQLNSKNASSGSNDALRRHTMRFSISNLRKRHAHHLRSKNRTTSSAC